MATKTKKKSGKTTTKKKKSNGKKVNIKAVIIPFVAIILVIVIAIVGIALHNEPSKANPFEGVNADCLKGVDVSHHNGKIDWKQMSKDVDFAIVRVGARGYEAGNIIEDKKARTNLKNAKKYGVPVGAYFYTQAVTPKEAQEEARFALKVVKKYDIELPIFIDFEYAYNKKGALGGRLLDANLTTEENTKIINAFCDVIEKAGYQSGVYASSYIYKWHLNMKALNKNCFIWVADYNENVTYNGDYDIWQYTSKGKMKSNGSKYIDLNYWYL